MKAKKHLGFTLLEVLLAVSLMSAISAVGIPLYQSYQVRNDLNIAANSLAQSFRRAQILSQSAASDSRWGVRIATGSITLFQGASYGAREASFDEVYTIPSSISVGGLQEVVFSKVAGLPQSNGVVSLTSIHNEIINISINAKGTVQY